MEFKVSIFSPTSDLTAATAFFRDSNLKIDHDGTDADWSQATVAASGLFSVRFTVARFTAQQGQFSKTMMGALNFFRTVAAKPESNRQVVLDRIKITKAIIGCVVTTTEDEDDGVTAGFIQLVTHHLNALLLAESAIFSAEGETLLDWGNGTD